jgi:hypothetical protein
MLTLCSKFDIIGEFLQVCFPEFPVLRNAVTTPLFMFIGTALRVTTGGKPGQTSLIQIPSSTQFAVVSQGNLLSVGQPRVIQTQLTNQQVW